MNAAWQSIFLYINNLISPTSHMICPRVPPQHAHTSFQPAEGGGLKLSFQLSISESRRQTTYIAFCFPFSYTECQKMLAKLEAKYSSEAEETNFGSDDVHSDINNKIYFHR